MKPAWMLIATALLAVVCVKVRLQAVQTLVTPPGAAIEHQLPEPAVHIVAATKWSRVGRKVQYIGPAQTQLRTKPDLLILPASWKIENTRASFEFAKPYGGRPSSRVPRQVALTVPPGPNYTVVMIHQGVDYGAMTEIDPSSLLDSFYQHTDTKSEDTVYSVAAKFKIIASPALAGTVVSWNENYYSSSGDSVTTPRFWTVTTASPQSPVQTLELSAPGDMWISGFRIGRPGLVADTNQDEVLGNDDSGSTGAAIGYLHSPNLGHHGDSQTPNAEDNVVNGPDDLANFFPVCLDLQSIMAAFPPDDSVKYKLKQADGALNFVYTNLTQATAFDYRSGNQTAGFGPGLDQSVASATTIQITADGLDIFNPPTGSPAFLDAVWSSGGGVILVEGRKISGSPLILSVEKDGMVISEIQLPLLLTPGELAADTNRDGVIKFASEESSDTTSSNSPYRFWLNDDVDRPGLTSGEEAVQDDGDPSLYPKDLDWQHDRITCERDLEYFPRLWINAQGLVGSNVFIGLKWKNIGQGTAPAIKLYPAVEADGGTKYLTDLPTASLQKALAVVKDASQPDAQINPIVKPRTGDYDFVLPASFVQNLTIAQPTLHFLFEGCQRGTGQLTLVFLQKDASGNLTKVADGPGIYLDLKNIKEMYERWWVGDGPGPGFSPSGSGGGGPPAVSAIISQDRLPAGAIVGRYTTQSPEQNQYILYVHGWNMHPWEKDAFAETAFKRLYWQGYKGRFGAFQWPTTYHTLAPAGLFDYDTGEYSSWLSARPLKNLLSSLCATYSGKVYVVAHSMGNVVTGEALRLAAQGGNQVVAAYVATQAAVPVHCYDSDQATPADFFGTWRSPPGSSLQIYVGTATTPNIYPNWLAANGTASGTRGSFYNPNDFALSRGAWETDQALKPNDVVGPRAPYGYTGDPNSAAVEDGFYYQTLVTSGSPKNPTTTAKQNPLHLGDGTNIMDRYEIMAFAAQPRSRALGTMVPVSALAWTGQDLRAPLGGIGVWPADSFSSTHDYSAHPWHSAQFRFTNMDQKDYWGALLGQKGFNLK